MEWPLAFLAVVGLSTLLGLAYALLATERFRAEVLLAPAEEKSLPAIAGQLGSLASFAGISVGGGESVEPIAVLRSRDFARSFIEDLDLLPVLLRDEWDAVAGTWKDSDPEKWPDVRDAVKYFDENVRTVSEDRKSGLVTLSVEWTDPIIAAEWAALLVRRLNERMRGQALAEAERNVRYLREEMAATSVVSLQQSIGRLLETELQKLMLAKGNEEFAFRVIDPASPPKRRSHPKRALTVVAAFLMGAFLSVIWVFATSGWRGRTIADSSSGVSG